MSDEQKMQNVRKCLKAAGQRAMHIDPNSLPDDPKECSVDTLRGISTVLADLWRDGDANSRALTQIRNVDDPDLVDAMEYIHRAYVAQRRLDSRRGGTERVGETK